MEKVMAVCLKCGSPLEEPAATGRPALYCSTACRRAAEFEIRRINRRLERLEERAGDLRHDRSNIRDWLGRTREQALEDTEAEIREAEARLRLLLAAMKGVQREDFS